MTKLMSTDGKYTETGKRRLEWLYMMRCAPVVSHMFMNILTCKSRSDEESQGYSNGIYYANRLNTSSHNYSCAPLVMMILLRTSIRMITFRACVWISCKRAFYFSDWHAQESQIFLLLHRRTRGARISDSCSVAEESDRDIFGASLAQLGLTIHSSYARSAALLVESRHWFSFLLHRQGAERDDRNRLFPEFEGFRGMSLAWSLWWDD